MPIRMVQDDPNDNEERNDDQGGGGGYDEQDTRGGGGGGGIGNALMFLPLLFSFFKKSPILLLAILGIGAFLYFKGCPSDNGGGTTLNDSGDQPKRGATLDPKEYDKAEVFEPLDPSKTPMPDRVSLLQYAPQRKDQGQQGSCVGWGSAYAARTIVEAASTGVSPDQLAFSPAFLYNQIGLDGCQGAYINNAMEVMQRRGSVPYNEFPYTDQDCERKPSQDLMQRAGDFRMRGYNRLTPASDPEGVDFNAIKQHLAAGTPVVIGMEVTNSFTYEMFGRKVWTPSREDYNGYNNLGGHCMCVIGYDDYLEGGAFQIMNSWGPKWGENGIGWVKYKDFMKFDREAYGLYQMPKRGAAADTRLACQIGLVENTSKKYIPLKVSSGNVFQTTQSVPKGTKFKIEVKNNNECYIYLFGQETDNSSYVLFPYNKKHSPYCGITGYRVFPRTESLMADDLGNKDYMAVVVSKEPLDYVKLNDVINKSRQASYQGKLMEALGGNIQQGVSYSATGTGALSFQTDTQNKAVAMIIEVNKQ